MVKMNSEFISGSDFSGPEYVSGQAPMKPGSTAVGKCLVDCVTHQLVADGNLRPLAGHQPELVELIQTRQTLRPTELSYVGQALRFEGSTVNGQAPKDTVGLRRKL